MSGGVAAIASCSVNDAALGHGLLDERDVALALRRQRSRVAGDVGRHLLRHHVVDLLAIAGDRMRGADVRAGRHRGDVSRNRDQEAGRRRAVPDGPTNTATGVFAAMIALLMSRVESTRPPGVRSVKTTIAAPSASACSMARANTRRRRDE